MLTTRTLGLVAVVVLPFLAGCATPVSEARLSDDVSNFVLGAAPSPPKSVFSPADEKVTLTVKFGYNFVGGYRTFRVRWVGPDGKPFLEEPTKTEWGSNETLIVSLPIANNVSSTMPGDWVVELWHKDELLVSRPFQIREPSS